MPGRNLQGDYRYAYQGQEVDPETGKEAFELRLWDSRIGRWLTTDPAGQYSSPYLGMGNNPITRYDPDGGCDQPDADCGFIKRAWYNLTGRGTQVDAWQEFHNPTIMQSQGLTYTDYFNINDGEFVSLIGETEDGERIWHHFTETGATLEEIGDFLLELPGPPIFDPLNQFGTQNQQSVQYAGFGSFPKVNGSKSFFTGAAKRFIKRNKLTNQVSEALEMGLKKGAGSRGNTIGVKYIGKHGGTKIGDVTYNWEIKLKDGYRIYGNHIDWGKHGAKVWRWGQAKIK